MSANLHEAQTIQQFLSRYPVNITLIEVPENPHMEDSLEKMINYHVTLIYEGRVMTLYYSTGLGWIEMRSGQRAWNVTYRKRDKLFLERRGNTLYDANASYPGRYRIRKPKVEDVLDCLASDASGIDESFEEWAANYGYDTDSRKAKRTYETCQRQVRELRQLLGAAAFDELLNNTERM